MAERERPDGHDQLLFKGPCPKCGSDDNLATYADGHSHCFTPSCGHHVDPSEDGTQKSSSSTSPSQAKASGLLDPTHPSSTYAELTTRRLTKESLRKYGVFLGGFNGGKVQVYPYYSQDGELSVQKLRLPNKEFVALKADGAPSLGKCRLFGWQVFMDKFDRQLIITEGELDAISVAQALDFKTAVVSVNTGAGTAAKVLKENYLWVDRFDEIVLWFDDDEPGREAAEECAALFEVGKVKIARAEGYKDASDILQANKPGDIKAALYAARAWRPQGIVNAKDNPSDVYVSREQVESYPYPDCMPNLQAMSDGMHPGEVIYHVAGTGVGKSTGLREIQCDLIHQGVKIGVLNFEDTIKEAKLGLMSIHVSEKLNARPIPSLDDTPALDAYDAAMKIIHDDLFGTGLVELFDPQAAEWTMKALMGYIRYCAKALDCKVIFIDPISFIAAGIALNDDERRVLDKVAGDLARLAKELNVHIQIAHHLKRTSGIPHEEGAPTSLNELRSSGGLANFAMGVIGWERNNQAAGDLWRVIQSRIIKPIRRTGKSGIADVLKYDERGRLIISPDPFPPIGKPKDGEDSTRGFSDVSQDY